LREGKRREEKRREEKGREEKGREGKRGEEKGRMPLANVLCTNASRMSNGRAVKIKDKIEIKKERK